MSVKPSLSVVIPAYNCESYIDEALGSVLGQGYTDLEVIVVDDASTDGTAQKLRQQAEKDSRIRVLTSASNSGQGACRNRATETAQGRYIAYLDADDRWLPDKLERQLEFMRTRGQPFSFCGYGIIDENSEVTIPDLKIPAQTDYQSLLKSNTICPSSVVYDREQLGDIVMPERPRRREDLIAWLGVSKQLDGRLHGIPDPLCMVRRISGSSSSNKLKVLGWQWNVYREEAGFGIIKALIYLAIFSFTSLAKRSPASIALKSHQR